MNAKITELVSKIAKLENDLKVELDKEENRANYKLAKGRVLFEKEALKTQREALIGLFTYLRETPVLYFITAPVIYALIIPAVILDLFVSFYQAINFRVYKIPRVKRSEYIIFDRQYLAYLNTIEKFNCLYCSYFNGLMGYVSEVAARTEQFWCPIKHAKKIAYRHKHYDYFLPYGNAEKYHENLESLREKLQKQATDDNSHL